MNNKNLLLSLLITIFFISLYFLFTNKTVIIKEVIFEIKQGEGISEIAGNLKKAGLIHTKTYFYIFASLTGTADRLQTGKYLLSKGARVGEIIKKFSLGETIPNENEIIIIPGRTIKDIGKYFKELNIAKEMETESFFSADRGFNYGFLDDKPKSAGYEGYLFPDTYRVFKDSRLEDIAAKIFDNFDKKFDQKLREEIRKQKKTVFEIITMASVLEKEVKILEDKKTVSGILWKRLMNKMPLQVDASLTYILGKTSRELTIGDLAVISSYNTYVNLGLPKGPISNPSSESILAAIYPQKSDFWYYLSAPDGKTIFSRNFEEHKAAKLKYLR